MTISLKHEFTSEKGDGTDPTKVQPSNWNEEHKLTMSSGHVLGRSSASDGPVEELAASPLGLAILAAATKAVLASLGVATTGDVKPTFKNVADGGWIILNDGSIGNDTSGATTRANADTADLYVLIWENVADAWAPVTGGRGVSGGLADFNAGKKLTLPRALGRALIGAGTGTGIAAKPLGAIGGEENHLLTTTEMPSHFHAASITDPGHSHAYSAPSSAFGMQPGGEGGKSSSISTFTGSSVTGVRVISSNGIDTTYSAGSNGSHNNMQPYMAVNFMVKL